MPIINVTLPSDGTTADVGDYNSVITAMLAVINGLLDDDNIAGMSGSKITAGTLPDTALTAESKKGWITGLPAPTSVTALGNRYYSMVFNSTDLTDEVSPGQRLRATRTVAAPTQSASLNGTNQSFSKSSPNKLTFTDDFAVGAWIKLSSYQFGTVISRYNGTSGWVLQVDASGRIGLLGYNAGSANFVYVLSYKTLPLNKWVYVNAQLDMSAFTATTSTCFVMIDGIDTAVTLTRGGTNPTALIQAGSLEIGSQNGGSWFAGKIAQAFVTNAKVTQATLLSYMSQGITGSETSIASAYSFNNAITDLNTTTPNDLTANGSALATSADSPFGRQANGTISSTLDYGIIVSADFSTNTTLVVRVPSGNTIPTSGGVNALAYSGNALPYGMPKISNALATVLTAYTFATASTSPSLVLGMTAPVYVAPGAELEISVFVPATQNTAGSVGMFISIWDGAVGSGTQLARLELDQLTATFQLGGTATVPASPIAGLRTFNIGFHTTSGTASLVAAITTPAYFSVKEL
jgi:hypothetical protein